MYTKKIKAMAAALGLTIMITAMPVAANAADGYELTNNNIETVQVVETGSAGAAAYECARQAYEAGVISQTAGRCGAATETGAKGIIFEILYKDKENIKNFFNETKTRLTYSPNAVQCDVVGINSNGNITKRFQCKDVQSTSGLYKTISQVESGQYNGAKLVGTTETASSYNSLAAEKNISKTMIDSGISTKDTTRLANKALGNITLADAGRAIGRSIGAGAIFGAAAGAVESVAGGDSVEYTAANVIVESGEGAVTFAAGTAAGEAAAIVLGTGAAATAGTVVVATGAAIAVGYGLNKVVEKTEAKEKLADFAGSVRESGADFTSWVKDVAGQF